MKNRTIADLSNDEILDFADTIIDTPSKADRRDRAFEAAHAKGAEACEVCGRALTAGSVRVGPTCLRKMRRAGLVS